MSAELRTMHNLSFDTKIYIVENYPATTITNKYNSILFYIITWGDHLEFKIVQPIDIKQFYSILQNIMSEVERYITFDFAFKAFKDVENYPYTDIIYTFSSINTMNDLSRNYLRNGFLNTNGKLYKLKKYVGEDNE